MPKWLAWGHGKRLVNRISIVQGYNKEISPRGTEFRRATLRSSKKKYRVGHR